MTIQSFENVAVMGAGAVGCYFGAMLARGRATVRLIGRQSLVDAVARDGLRLESAGFSERVRVAATTDPAGVSDAGLVLFCVKSLDTEEAARAIAPHLRPGAVVLGMQNGVDNFQRMRAYIGNDIVPAVVYVAAEIVAPGCVRHNGGGDLVIGAPRPPGRNADRPPIANLAGFLAGAGIPVRISDNIEGALWTKLMLNCAYNAVSALGRSRYAGMVAMPPVRRIMIEAAAEIVALARAKRVRLEGGDPVEAMFRLAETMPDQVSSTAQDIARGRRTEIDDLNGYVVRQSDALGLPAPVNRTLHALVKLLETSPHGPSS
jgi:2-dehydropantoate 2-reductase